MLLYARSLDLPCFTEHYVRRKSLELELLINLRADHRKTKEAIHRHSVVLR